MDSSTPRRSAVRRCTARAARAAALVWLGILGTAPAVAGVLNVTWQDQRLWVSADDVPRAEVLREVARRTGARIRGIEQLTDRVTLRVTAVDLGVGLRELAAGTNYALRQGSSRRAGARPSMELIVAPQGTGYRQTDVMNRREAAAVLVEDVRSGTMVAHLPPSTPVGPQPDVARPDASPVAVRIDTE